ncbi:hypothetical protein BC938DRAFT_483427 [Jimgerdemannia flammicorona]|uniref:Uncharacterized protein n=1 Tax=Jimgerdemannia flammicorona TaxID=994334 RepID=A0A433QVS5_9FUNG|nr:hypothetical protein BC938DRAFT_483427 [Jimgerdemannia flammicorona]
MSVLVRHSNPLIPLMIDGRPLLAKSYKCTVVTETRCSVFHQGASFNMNYYERFIKFIQFPATCFGKYRQHEGKKIIFLRKAISWVFCCLLLGISLKGLEDMMTNNMSVEQSTEMTPSVPPPGTPFCVNAAGTFQSFDHPECPHVSPIYNQSVIFLSRRYCYSVQPVGVILNSTHCTAYVLTVNFVNSTTGYIAKDPTLQADVQFFHPSSNILVNPRPEIANDSNPFFSDLLRTQRVIGQKTEVIFGFSQVEWKYPIGTGIWLSKFGLPFAYRGSITTLDYTIQELSRNDNNSVLTVYCNGLTKRVNKLVPTTTLSSVASSIGGFFGLLSTIYALLFGAKRLDVWGWLHALLKSSDDEEIYKAYSPSKNEGLDKAELTMITDHYVDLGYLKDTIRAKLAKETGGNNDEDDEKTHCIEVKD